MQQRMDKFLTKTSTHVNVDVESPTSNKRTCVEFNPENLISDPGRREQIDECNVNIRDQVRRAYLAKGYCQPLNYEFPKTQYGIERRSFQKSWFKEFDWLKYSIKYDHAYCLWCYLFKPNRADNSVRDVFSATGFNNWKMALEVFRDHIEVKVTKENATRALYEIELLKAQAVQARNALMTRLSDARAAAIAIGEERDTIVWALERSHLGSRPTDEAAIRKFVNGDSFNEEIEKAVVSWVTGSVAETERLKKNVKKLESKCKSRKKEIKSLKAKVIGHAKPVEEVTPGAFPLTMVSSDDVTAKPVEDVTPDEVDPEAELDQEVEGEPVIVEDQVMEIPVEGEQVTSVGKVDEPKTFVGTEGVDGEDPMDESVAALFYF
ncbi:hypothetical protein POM88_021098 [Heracleum sosnowskyi]|uniref:TTF-type domain-containing protein n=1 Tax=Heracleum sosnowskyi TaxID=360622 RepID=A0AAD8IDV4_9APIA|nr:hypothetical protein POM88_021098 [Heracleum sosnowskyi]